MSVCNFACVLLIFALMQVSCKSVFTKWLRLDMNGNRYGTSYAMEGPLSTSQCIARCAESMGCVSVNVNSYNLSCELSMEHPMNDTLPVFQKPGWTVYMYYKDTMGCIPDPCENGGSCTDGVNSFTCTCASGFTGPTCQTNINDCIPDPCENGGYCNDGVNSFNCSCAAGFAGFTCQTQLQWVQNVTAFSSEYSSTSWGAIQVIGPPNVYPTYGENPIHQWEPKVLDSNQFLEVQFAEAVYITGVEIYETSAAGRVKAIKALGAPGNLTTLWSTTGIQVVDTARVFAPQLSVAIVSPCRNLRIELDCTGRYVGIDAVKLVGTK